MISKELLKVLFQEEVTTEISIQNAWCDHTGQELEWKEISFNFKSYPLDFVARKAKQWVTGMGYVFFTNRFDACLEMDMKEVNFLGLTGFNGTYLPEFEAETEPEVIFKACQWVLDNKENE